MRLRHIAFALFLALPLVAQEDSGTCDNDHRNAHACQCEKTTTDRDHCPPGGLVMTNKCTHFCYPDQCKCVTVCDTVPEQ